MSQGLVLFLKITNCRKILGRKNKRLIGRREKSLQIRERARERETERDRERQRHRQTAVALARSPKVSKEGEKESGRGCGR